MFKFIDTLAANLNTFTDPPYLSVPMMYFLQRPVSTYVRSRRHKKPRQLPTRPPVWRLRRARHRTRSRSIVKPGKTGRRSTKQRKLTKPRQNPTSRATNRRSKTRPRSHFLLGPCGVLMVWVYMASIGKRRRSSTRTS